ncbi:MAG: sensor histidine kinase [Anaerolineales bacterium]
MPLLRSLRARLIATYLVLILLSVGGLVSWIAPQLRKYAEEQVEHELELEAHLAALLLREPVEKVREGEADEAFLVSKVQEYLSALNSELRLTIFDADFHPLFSSDPQIVLGTKRQAWPELRAASQKQERHDIRWDEVSGEERIFAAAPLINGNNAPIAFVQLSFPTAPVWQNVHRAWITLFGVVMAVAAVTIGSGLWLTAQVVGPLEQLTAVIHRIAAGNLKERALLRGPQEVQQLAKEFNEMADRLERMIQRQQEFVANAAHELRSPLTSIRLRLELILTQLQDDPQMQRQYLEQVLEEIERLRKMTDQLLMLSSLEHSNRLPPAMIDPAPLLYEVSDEIAPLFHLRHQAFMLEVPPHLPKVQVNAEELRIILRNLLDNATKYTQEGGKIRLQARSEAGNVLVTVQDNGPGISEEALPHIFERFYRGDKSRSRSAQGGSGLGLSLVKELVQLNNGQIEVKSAPGQGSTFTLRFPVVEEKG